MSGHSCIPSRIASAVITAAALIGASCLMPESFASSSTRASRQHSTAKRSVWRAPTRRWPAGRSASSMSMTSTIRALPILLSPRDAQRARRIHGDVLLGQVDRHVGEQSFGRLDRPGRQRLRAPTGLGRAACNESLPATPSPIAGGYLVAPTRAARGSPSIPQVLASSYANAPDNIVNPAFQYGYGSAFNPSVESGVATVTPPVIQRIQPAMIPFARALAERLPTGDPRPSLEERYGSHAEYVAAVTAAADNAMAQGILLRADRAALIAVARAGTVSQ